ncbi:MAG TPA: glycosyltransferase family 2 protein [Candidatus Acidoferrum sp.]|jgi:glycosyltransferase involved in cell wall biosynthesis|nr:glycosyltransferase family 2 protein [Candidatus Acidoferrum sp.]
MRDPRSLWIVIPAYNEAESIGRVVASLRSEGRPVVVVDDGSSDQTAEIARAAGATVLRHLLNLGQGGALQTGITFCLESGAQYICTFDADGQHCAEDVEGMWELLLTGGYDIVLGSRFLGAACGMPLSRKLLLKLAVLFTYLHSGLKLTDAHNGLRVMTAESASRLALKQMGMAHASEIIDRIASLKLKYAEAPVTVLYTNYSKAKGQSALGSVRILMDLLIGRMLR